MGRDGSKNKGRGGRGSGKKMFIANVEELQMRNMQISEAQEARAKRREEDSDEDGDEKESEDEEPKDSVFSFSGCCSCLGSGRRWW